MSNIQAQGTFMYSPGSGRQDLSFKRRFKSPIPKKKKKKAPFYLYGGGDMSREVIGIEPI